jgi:hypothetical protein
LATGIARFYPALGPRGSNAHLNPALPSGFFEDNELGVVIDATHLPMLGAGARAND